MAQSGASYLGGLSWAPEPGWGNLTLNQEVIDLTQHIGTLGKTRYKPIVKVQVKAIECVEIVSEQVAKSKAGAVILFGVLGGLAAKGSEHRASMLVHMKSGQTGYFTIDDYSAHELTGKLTPWLQSISVRLGAPKEAPPPSEPVALNPISVADEISKLGKLKAEGLLTEQEFAAEKARLLSH
jgi:hypothetical protein